jgi:hypothetical protein
VKLATAFVVFSDAFNVLCLHFVWVMLSMYCVYTLFG